MAELSPFNYALFRQWMREKLDPQSIREKLIALGHDETSVESHLQAFAKMKQSDRQTNGFIVTGIGAVLGFISCVLTVINPVPEIYNLILYGLTSIAILTICYGLYLIFE